MMLLLLACEVATTQVNLLGTVQDAPFNGGTPVSGAALETRNREGNIVDDAETDSDGAFAIAVDSGESFFLTVSHPEYVSTGFSGVAGLDDFQAGDGYPWIATASWIEALRAEHVNCPTATAAGGIVVGEVRVAIAEVPDANQWPTLGGVVVQVQFLIELAFLNGRAKLAGRDVYAPIVF